MRVRVTRADELGPTELAVWRELVATAPGYESPYFAPQFTQAVASTNARTRVAVVEDGGRVAAFLPFERGPLGLGRPVGGSLSDYHGLIHDPALEWSAEELIRGCGLSALDYDHLLATQAQFEPYHTARAESPQMDLSRGFDAYREEVRARSRKLAKSTEALARRLEREIGTVQTEFHSGDRGHLEQLIAWKSRQFARSGLQDPFGRRSVRELIERILATRDPDFAGVLSVLKAGDRLVAAHLGMRSANTLHWWFPSYDEELSLYSPGRILIWRIAEEAARRSLHTIDLGRGNDPYKQRLSSRSVALAEGRVELPGWVGRARRLARDLEAWARTSSVTALAVRPIVRAARSAKLSLTGRSDASQSSR